MTRRAALEPGDRFPRLAARNADGEEATIPDDFEDAPLVLLLYRGHW